MIVDRRKSSEIFNVKKIFNFKGKKLNFDFYFPISDKNVFWLHSDY